MALIPDREQRGGAPPCGLERVTRFMFAMRLAKSSKTKVKRAALVAEHLDAVPGAVVIDERADGDLFWLTVRMWPPLRLAEAVREAEGCPYYAPGSFKALG